MRGTTRGVVTILLLVLIHLTVPGTGVASAQVVSCEARVGDPAGLLDPSEVSVLADLIGDLQAGGVQAHVHLLERTDAGIDRWFATAEASCEDWRDGGDRAPDLLVLAVSLGDRETGTWFGEDLEALEGSFLSVHDRMASQLRVGDHGGALATGLRAYADLLAIPTSVDAAPAPVDEPAAPTQQPDAAPPTGPEQPGEVDGGPGERVLLGGAGGDASGEADGDGLGGWWALLGLLGLGGVIAGGVVVVRRARERRRAHQAASAVRAAVRERYVTLDRRWGDLIDLATLARGRLAEDDRHAVTIEHERAQAADAMQALTAAYVETEQAHDTESRTGTEDLREAERAWTGVRDVADATETELAHVEAAVADVDRAEHRCEGLLGGHDERLQRARTAVASAAAAGFRVEAMEQAIARAVADHDAGRTAHGARRLGDAEDDLGRAGDTLDQITSAANGMPDRHRDLVARHAELAERQTATTTAVAAVSATVKRLRDGYARAIWDPVDGAPRDAAEAMAQIEQALDAAAHASTMQAQRFDEADAALAAAAAGLDVVDTVITGVRTVEGHLRSAEAEYTAAQQEASTDLHEALRFAREHAGDVDAAHLPALERAQSVYEEAVRLAGDVRPDPVAALHRLREVETTADAILQRCRSEKQRRDAARSRARSRITDARRSIDQARSRSGFGLFGWSARVKSELDEADSRLRTAGGLVQEQPEEAQRIASSAERTALNILEEARRRSQSTGDDRSFGGSGSGFSVGGSSGGSSGGGGSSSFGGGGGGSSRW